MNALGLVTITGIAAGLGVVLAMIIYLKATGQPLIDRGGLSESDLAAEKRTSLWAALSPWILLTIFSLLVNAPFLPFFDWTFNKLAMPVEIVPRAAEKVRLLWQAYFWILVSHGIGAALSQADASAVADLAGQVAQARASPGICRSHLFCDRVCDQSLGQGQRLAIDGRQPQHGAGVARLGGGFGRLYPLVAPYLGLLGGFISGSETSAIAMLTALHLSTAEKIKATGCSSPQPAALAAGWRA